MQNRAPLVTTRSGFWPPTRHAGCACMFAPPLEHGVLVRRTGKCRVHAVLPGIAASLTSRLSA
eukprot:8886837-Alexandrium_andersonii.AAC.1